MCDARVPQFHQGDVVKVTFDADAGTLKFAVNGAAQEVGFTGLRGKVLYPAIAFYSGGRAASVVVVASTGRWRGV